MKKQRLPSASYNLWSQFQSPVGKEEWHCDMKRGFSKVRNNEPQVKSLLEKDNKHQRIGKLAQRGVYEFHQDIELLNKLNGVEKIVDLLELDKESEEIQARVITILEKYCKNPILIDKEVIQLAKGDEGYPKPININSNNFIFNLYAPTDCIFIEQNKTIHILDFKTGKSDFDQRQAYVYLLAARYLFPNQSTVASFYNLENGIFSEQIVARPERLNFVEIELAELAKKYEQEKQLYWQNKSNFAMIFPPNPGVACKYCAFNSICNFCVVEVY